MRRRLGLAAGLVAGLVVPTGCVDDPDCGICDPHELVLQSISGVNYASRKIHLLSPPCEGERCPEPLSSGRYFIDPIGPCEQSEEALESPRGVAEHCRLSPLVTAFGIEFVFNNLLDPTSVELVRRRPDNPQLYEVYDWKTQVLQVEGPLTRFNGDYYLGASGDPDRVTRSVNLACIDNLRDKGIDFGHEDQVDPVTNPCNQVDPDTGLPLKMRMDGVIKATRGRWDSRALADGGGANCSNPEVGPDTCCTECDLILSTRVAKYGVLGNVDTSSGAVLEDADLLNPDNLRRPLPLDGDGQTPPGGAFVCDVSADPLTECRGFVPAVDRSRETMSYDYFWSCDPSEPGCARETFSLPYYDKLRETHPDDRPQWLETRTHACSSSAQCQDLTGLNLPGSICVGTNAEGNACSLDADDPSCTEGACIAPWFVTCRAQPDTTGAAGYCVDTRYDDKAAGGCWRSTTEFTVCNDEQGCATAQPQTPLAYCDADEDGRLLAEECCWPELGGPFVEDGRCDPVTQRNLSPLPRAVRNRFLPEVTRNCVCSDLADASAECRDAVAATCVDEDGRLRPERAGEYAVKLVTKPGGIIYDPAIKGFEWQPADWGGVPRAAAEACAEQRGLITARTVQDGWRANDAFDQRSENFEDFDRAMCSGQSYTVVFQTPGEGEFVQDKLGNALTGRSVYTFETSQFHVVPGSGFPSDNLRIGACDDYQISFSNKYDLSPENLAKVELWRIDEAGGLLPPAEGCDDLGPVAGGPDCALTDDDRAARGGECVPPCLTLDTDGHQIGVLGVRIDPAEFRAVLQPGERYRVSVPGLADIGQMADPAAYQAAFWDACGMPLVVGVPGTGEAEYTYDFFIDEPKCKEDLDLDGLQFSCDNAEDVYNRDQRDFDHDGVGDVVDLCPTVPSATINSADSDRDGVGNDCDNCRQAVKQYNEDGEELGVPFYMFARNIPDQSDFDGDGIGDACDNCPTVPNCEDFGPENPYQVGEPIAYDDPGRCQRDDDANLIGDACDGLELPGSAGPVGFSDLDDFDQDGVINLYDACPRQPLGDLIQCASDADCPATRRCEKVDAGDELGVCDHADTDGDGLGDVCDSCAFVANPTQLFDGVVQLGDQDGDFIGQECETGASCVDRNDPRPMAFVPVSSAGYCCTVELRVETDGSITNLLTGRTMVDPDDVPVRIDCTPAQEDARQCRALPQDVVETPGVLTLPPGCDEALADAGLTAEDNRSLTLEDVDDDLVELWGYRCMLPPRDQDHDGVGDACDLCDFAWDPENVQYVDANGRLWPQDGAFCNGDYAPDVVCQDDDAEGTGTGTGGETEGGMTGTGGSSTGG